ncbi:aldo/keto reductase [Aquitalea sp. LB_tupeE]|uniref:aldo/keto reductase n=1 Tax=Aquitalea sp. LB_tupeE TaxID=2748078 RepID=UPI0015BEC28C|nr:aldo/keto reductase [Aquitalea sp. LB_tupeE]NWK76413.1 aldo/keto reductase [Aquitalea sp. LB_tupeE]
MEYVNLGRSGLKVSRLCMGTMSFGSSQWRPWVLDEADSRPILQRALALGINFFDMADFYSLGVGEEVVGRTLLQQTRREQLVLASKAFYAMGNGPNDGGLSRKHLMDAIDGSLRRIGTDYLDLYIVHGFDPDTPIEETMEALHDIVKSGKARYIGASTMYAWQFARMQHVAERHGWTRFVSMQCQLNAAYREEEREMIPFCQDQGIAVTPFSPLARGLLSGAADSLRNQTDNFTQEFYGDEVSWQIGKAVERVAAVRGVAPAQVAQAWVLRRPGVTSMLVGADAVSQLELAVAALDLQLSDAECFEIDRHYTPCDVINDHHNAQRIPRTPR